MLLVLAVAACSLVAPPKYFLLNASAPSRPMAATAAATPRRTLAIDPVALPDYLNRLEIVTRTAGNSLTVSDSEKWGERLQSGIDRVLVLDLGALLAGDGIVVASGAQTRDIDYELAVFIDAFEREPGGNAVLAARWTIRDGRRSTALTRGQAVYSEPTEGPDFAAQVAGMNRALGRLTADLAAAIRAVR
jgi:uncharacterized lipoprotein YmbA